MKTPKGLAIKFGEMKELNQNSVKVIIVKTLNIYTTSDEVNNIKYFVFLIHEQHQTF
jgi:hypothetical protein